MCQPHWDKMRTGVQQRGMWQLVAPTSEEALQAVTVELGLLQDTGQ